METCGSLIALSIERDQSVLEAQEAELQVQAEQLRNSLLSSVSHDLRTPLAAIAGASSSLLDGAGRADEKTRRELLQSIVDESGRLARLVDNLLDMTRLESGIVPLNKQWHVLEEIVGSARSHLGKALDSHQHSCRHPSGLSAFGRGRNADGTSARESSGERGPLHSGGKLIDISARQPSPECRHYGCRQWSGTNSRQRRACLREILSGLDGSHGGRPARVGPGPGNMPGDHPDARRHKSAPTIGPDGGAEFVITLPCEKAAAARAYTTKFPWDPSHDLPLR